LKIVIFHSYVKLPEGNPFVHHLSKKSSMTCME
jgi:hypothetical protein